MFCNRCGATIQSTDRRCPACGESLTPEPAGAALAPRGRVARHHMILGGLWIARAVMVEAAALFVLAVSSHGNLPPYGLPKFGPNPTVVASMLRGIGWGLVGLGILMLIAGIGLLLLRSWARLLTIVLGILDLVSIPLGTALGIYTLWVLAPGNSEVEYAALSRAQGQ